ncbi:MAG: LacI family DNA-binding transcriptional regulator [bacterium]|nr:LacI family DNA-binding transcriptional regulator [bacterium]
MRKPKKVTISEIAKKAGTSVTAVSFVLNNKADKKIKPEIQKRILRIIDKHGYKPNIAAQGLARRKTLTVNLCILGSLTKYDYLTYHQHYDALRGFSEELNNLGYVVKIVQIPENLNSGEIEEQILKREKSDGAAFLMNWPSQLISSLVDQFKKHRYPYVCMNIHFREAKINCVYANDEQGMYKATSHLIKLGHKLVGIIGYASGGSMFEGYKKGLKDNGIDFTQELVGVDTSRKKMDPFKIGYFQVKKLLNASIPPTGIVCQDDITAFGVLYALAEHGIKVPEQIAVVGFGDDEYSKITIPKLTTVRKSGVDIGRESAKMLVGKISDSDFNKTPTQKVLEEELIIRESCGASRLKKGITS